MTKQKNKKKKEVPLKITGSFIDVLKTAVKGNPKPKRKPRQSNIIPLS